MHQSALKYAKHFFDTYKPNETKSKVTVVEIGSRDVNGSIREVCPSEYSYIGLDFAEGEGVDLVIDDPYKLPLEDASADIVVSSSCFEHSEFFWLTFLEALRILKDDGVFYLNAPSNGFFHQWPVDCWRFYPDAGNALVRWAARNGYNPELLEAFTGEYSQGTIDQGGMWRDYVAVFLKNNKNKNNYKNRMVDSLENIQNGYSNRKRKTINFSELGPDFELIEKLFTENSEQSARLEKLNQILEQREAQIVELTDETVRRGEWALGLISELESERARYMAITRSNSWRLALPLREFRRWINAPFVQTKRYVKAALRITKSVYKSLPLSHKSKQKHRNFISKLAPRLLLATGTPQHTISSLVINKVTPLKPIDVEHSTKGCKIHSVDLEVPNSADPIVSVVIPVYGEIEYTLRCIRSIIDAKPEVPFEVIVVDDCSLDDTFDVLDRIDGIKILKNESNSGFIRSCNRGASEARAEYILFLNNDTEVHPNWMESLLQTFYDFPGTGLAGSKLVYPDGRLQEAGGIIWKDGSAWNFGRFQDPQLPVYNYAREVDYCSGASIMVPKSLFDELDGFDEHYLPAYCEDSDLALRLRDKGYRVIYQPQSIVTHYEGVTSGTDVEQGVKAYQIENSRKLFTRWQQRLRAHQEPGTDVDNAKDRTAKRRVIVLDHCTPTPNQDAGSVTVFNLLLLLREMEFQVTFIPEDNFLYMPGYTSALQAAGIEVLYAPQYTSVAQHLKEDGQRYDLAFLFRPGVVERHLHDVRKYCPRAKAIFHTVDLHFLRMSREAELLNDRVKLTQAGEMKERELAAIRACDASIVHSTAEFELLRTEVPGIKLHVFPLIMDVPGTTVGFQARNDLVFVGGYQHSPNVDAVKYMANEIMPLLRERLPGVRFFAVGSNPPAEIKALAADDIIVTGFVEDLSPLLDKMRVSVAPLRYGAGIKGKIGTAMAAGLPVVATSLAAEGMSVTDGKNILVADGAIALADKISNVYRNEPLWTSISDNGIAFAEGAWGSEAAWRILGAILADVDLQVIRSETPLSLYASSASYSLSTANVIRPIGSANTRQEYEEIVRSPALQQIEQYASQLLHDAPSREFTVTGRCAPCNKNVSFLVDMQSGGQEDATGWTPNWRERLECPSCHMNNRQRLIATLIQQILSKSDQQSVYLMEQVTPIFNWAKSTFPTHKIMGSEYLGHEYAGGVEVNGIRHEDVEALSFENESIDLIISNDVFEHVPNPILAFSECKRVLKTGGVMVATIPFHSDEDLSVVRAKLSDGILENILPEMFHGNPVSQDGSLVFTDFGWDILNWIKSVGFSRVQIDIYADKELCHFGGGQLIFKVEK